MTAEQLAAEWADRWPRKSQSTTTNTMFQLRHFARWFGVAELEAISRSDFRKFALAHPGAARYARTALNDAVDDGLLEENPASKCRVPRPATKAVVIPTAQEVYELIVVAQEVSQAFAFLLEFSAYTGLREGEARALAKVSPDFKRGEVVYSMTRDEQLKEPKTPASKAPFALLGPAPSIARVMHFAPGRGERLFPITYVARAAMWETTRHAAGLPHLKWHSLRHFHATWLLDQGKAIDDVALQLRCSVDEIRRTYGKPDREAALARLES